MAVGPAGDCSDGQDDRRRPWRVVAVVGGLAAVGVAVLVVVLAHGTPSTADAIDVSRTAPPASHDSLGSAQPSPTPSVSAAGGPASSVPTPGRATSAPVATATPPPTIETDLAMSLDQFLTLGPKSLGTFSTWCNRDMDEFISAYYRMQDGLGTGSELDRYPAAISPAMSSQSAYAVAAFNNRNALAQLPQDATDADLEYARKCAAATSLVPRTSDNFSRTSQIVEQFKQQGRWFNGSSQAAQGYYPVAPLLASEDLPPTQTPDGNVSGRVVTVADATDGKQQHINLYFVGTVDYTGKPTTVVFHD